MEIVHVGFGNILSADRILVIASTNSAPIKRLIQEGKNKGIVIDLTNGRKTKSLLILDSGHLVLSALAPRTLINRLSKNEKR